MTVNMPVKIVQPAAPAPEIPTEVLATAIVEISAAMKKIDAGRLKREALVLLIHANSGVGKPDVRLVLNNLEALEAIWLKPAAKKGPAR